MTDPVSIGLDPRFIPEFQYVAPKTVADAVSLMASHGSKAKVIAGGSDLLYRMKREAMAVDPELLIDIKGIGELNAFSFDPGRGLNLGALVTIATLEGDSSVGEHYPLLSQAASLVASPQVRNVATVGGALTQQVWCWFLRNGLKTLRSGGTFCYAIQKGADSRYYHSVMGDAGSGCYAVHPSDIAVALHALDASVTVAGLYGTKTVTLDAFLPGNVLADGVVQSHILSSAELLTSVSVPPPSPGKSVFLKARMRNAFDMAMASVAVRLVTQGDLVTDARVVFGGIAPSPYRDAAVEGVVKGRGLSSVALDDAAAVALSAARPLSSNAYKVDLAKGLLKEALLALA